MFSTHSDKFFVIRSCRNALGENIMFSLKAQPAENRFAWLKAWINVGAEVSDLSSTVTHFEGRFYYFVFGITRLNTCHKVILNEVTSFRSHSRGKDAVRTKNLNVGPKAANKIQSS